MRLLEKKQRGKILYSITVTALLLMGGSLLSLYHQTWFDIRTLYIAPFVRIAYTLILVLAVLMILMAVFAYILKHSIYKGFRYFFLHARLMPKVRKALLEAGFYIKENNVVRLPKIILFFNDDCTHGTVIIESHIKHVKPFDTINLSSCLGDFIVDQNYLSDDGNKHIFKISHINLQKQRVFNSESEFFAYSKDRCGDYELFVDDVTKINIHHLLIVGQTGSGKTYASVSFILQLLDKSVKHQLYFADPKTSTLLNIGQRVSKENTAYEINDIVDLLRTFNQKMDERKLQVKERLNERENWDGEYSTFGFPANILVFDEFASFQANLSGLPKKERDETMAILRTVVLQGRQLGFFLILAMQKSDATTISTDIRDNLVGKFVLGTSERTTYETCFGASGASNVPNRLYQAGQGVFTYSGIGNGKPEICHFPTLNFDVLEAIESLLK